MQHQIMIFRSLEDASLSDLGTPASILLQESYSHTGGPSCKQALLLSWQQSSTSPITQAGVQAISICGWSKICSDVYSSGDVHVAVPSNVKLGHLSEYSD